MNCLVQKSNEDGSVAMKRTPLTTGSIIQAKGGLSYVIDRVIGDGASSMVYEAHYMDSVNGIHNVRLKECYPYASDIKRVGAELVWADLEIADADKTAFRSAYHKLLEFQNTTKLRNSTARVFDLLEMNGTLYSVMDVNEGWTFNQDKSEKLLDILKTILALSRVVEKYHNNRYLHLDIKPGNFLVIPETRELIILFDVDSVTSMEDIALGRVKCVPFSKGWASPEQVQGKIDKLCPATDIYSIGAILFQKVMGRSVENEDTGVFADWDFDGEIFDDVNPKIKRLLREIFKNTLTANVKRRYQTTDQLINALNEACEIAEQDVYLVTEDIISEIEFVGRNHELANMHELFGNDTKAIFLHGFGGVGKTALARRFAELYAPEYDCVQFHRYTKDLSEIIDNNMLSVDCLDNPNAHKKQLGKACDNTKALIIIDNFDVEDDEDLEYLLSLNVDLIFTTRNDYTEYFSVEKIEIVELESLPTEELVTVFKNEYGKPISEDDEELVEEIIEKFGNITILVPIIAKQIISSKISIKDFYTSIEDNVFARFDEENEDIRIRKDGKSQRTNSLEFIRAMFNIAGLSDKHKIVLRYLYLLKYHRRLTIKEYRRITGEKNLNILNDLQFRNWISYINAEDNEETEIKVHQLIYDLVEKDDYPTCQNVPGIMSYIDTSFNILTECINEEVSAGKISIDFDTAECITYALLLYDDIKSSDNKDDYDQRIGRLYSFMCLAFLDDPYKTYKLFFESPEESTYYFYVHGIMDLLPYKRIVDCSDFLSAAKYEGLEYETTKGEVKFPNVETKSELLGWIINELNITNKNCSFIIVPYFVMLVYFYSLVDESDSSKSAIESILIIEEIISKRQYIIDESLTDTDDDLLAYRLRYYLNICQSPIYTKEGKYQSSDGVDVKTYYEFYLVILNLLQKALCSQLDDHDRQHFTKKAEEIIIILEQQNERFAAYGYSLDDIISYIPPTVQEYEKNISLHWSKKSDIWYKTVDCAISNVNNPYVVYSLLLLYDYQNDFLNNSKIKKLINTNLADRIYNDGRLTLEEKTELLIDFVIVQVRRMRIKRNIKKRPSLLNKILPKAELYYQVISKIDDLIPNWKNEKLDTRQVEIIDIALDLRQALGKEFFDINNQIHSICTSIDNIDFVGEMLYLADKLRMCGWIKRSKEIKNQILDLTLGCLTLYSDALSGHTLQMILYKVRPLAIKCKREDVVSEIDKIEMTLARKYSLNLIDPLYDVVSVKSEEQDVLARKFMDDYIDMVALEAYESMHGIVNTNKGKIDEMEHLLAQNLEELLRATDLRNGYYRWIFDNPYVEGWHRSLHPFWAREFHSTENKEVNIGLCYLIAQYCDDIPYNNVIKESLEYLTEEDSYDISKDELQTVLDNIKKIYPKFKN